MRLTPPLLLAGLIGLALCSGANAASISTADGSGADTYLTNDSNSGPAAVHGAEEIANLRSLVQVTSSGPPDFTEIINGVRARVSVFRFDLSAGPIGDNVALQLTQVFGRRDRTTQVYGLNDGAADSWDESTTAYENFPGVVAADAGKWAIDPTATTLLGNFDVIDNRVSGTDTPTVITSDPLLLPLDDFLAADTNGLVTLLLTYDDTNTSSDPDWTFATKETTAGHQAPTLVALVPEPGSAAIAALSALMLSASRRRG